MGGKRGRIQRRHFKQSRDNVWKRPRVEGSSEAAETFSQDQWEPLVTQNEAFEQYYKEQGILCEQEWEQFIAILQKSLPATFRINSSALFCGDILLQLENDFLASLTAEDTCGNMIEQMRPLPWYPNKFAWHLNYSRSQLRKNRTLERFHEFLKLENEIGNITRQEAVSMVPPLFLDVQPQHYILDMCAAPGSKTFQLLEMIHKPDSLACLPAGLVIANDVDVQRCNLLIHQTKRMCSANLIVTNHEAQHFPSCHSKDRSMMVDSIAGNEDSAIAHLNQSIDKGTMSHLLFDRILCDVPCSGDGTIRKAPDIWRKWNTGLGNGVHKLQVQIAMRGVSLLKVGGRLVYSTCSMNPVENEAVVAEVLRQSQGSLELLDVSSELPDLKRRPGLKCWKVRDRGKWLSSYRQVDRHRRYTILPSMFPSGATFNDGLQMDVAVDQKEVDGSKNKDEVPCKDLKADVFNGCSGDHGNLTTDLEGMLLEKNNSEVDNCEAETSSLPLERCMRIVPHDQDTGAFFVAVLKKVSHLSVENAKSTATRKGSTRESKQDTKDQVMSNVQMGSNDTNVHANDEEKEETDVDSCSYAKKSIESQASEKESGKNEGENLNVIPDVENNAITEMNTTAMPDNQRDKRMPQQQSRWRGIDPVLFFTDESSINSIKDFYGIDHTCALLGHLVVRNSELTHPKRIYYVSSSVRDVIKLNIHAGQQLKIASIGLKVFERQTLKEGTSQCMYRISSEGLPLLLPFLKKQIIYVPLLDLVLLLSRRSINFKTFQDQRVQSEALNLLPGCCVVALNKDDAGVPSEVLAPIAVVCWKGKTSLSLMVSKSESEELLERLAFKYGKDIVNGIMLNENTRCISEGEDTILSNDAQEDIPEI